jgi:two-component system chemotaxis sensor kinase CheA
VLIVVDTESHGQAVLMVDSISTSASSSSRAWRPIIAGRLAWPGATILGDGKVALILDVDSLVADNFAQHGTSLAA